MKNDTKSQFFALQLFANRDALEDLNFGAGIDSVKSCSTVADETGAPVFTVVVLSAGEDEIEINDTVFIMDHERRQFCQATRGECDQIIQSGYKKAM